MTMAMQTLLVLVLVYVGLSVGRCVGPAPTPQGAKIDCPATDICNVTPLAKELKCNGTASCTATGEYSSTVTCYCTKKPDYCAQELEVGGACYNSTVDCVAMCTDMGMEELCKSKGSQTCSGSFSETVPGAAVDCRKATDRLAKCDFTTIPGYRSCTGSVTCLGGSYWSTLKCIKEECVGCSTPSPCQIALCMEGKCIVEAKSDGESCPSGVCSNGQCVEAKCAGPCSTCGKNGAQVALTGSLCFLNEIPGVCTADKRCAVLDDDCRSNPCPLGQTCYDNDRVVNQKFECRCPIGQEMGKAGCQPSACDALQQLHCFAEGKQCTATASGTQCAPPECQSMKACSDSCSLSPFTDHSGCLLGCSKPACPAITVMRECIPEDCEAEGLKMQKRKTCIQNVCLEVPCPLVTCPAPRLGCVLLPVVSGKGEELVDPFGCPLFPCGKEVCRSACSGEQRSVCAARVPRQDCMMLGTDPLCVPFSCPVAMCSPPPGCRYEKGTHEVDAMGCPLAPCGKLVCDTGCGSTCITCVNGNCTQRACPPKQACIPSPNCWYELSDAVGPDGCPLLPCGREVCSPTDICSSVQCEPGDKCVTMQGRGVCVRPRTSQKERIFFNEPACQKRVCPHGQVCVEGNGDAECVKEDEAMCNGCDEEGMQCVPVPVDFQGPTATTWKCIRKEEAPCARDLCSCKGTPCEEWEVCTVVNSTATCVARDPTPRDVCAQTVCKEGFKCRIVNHVAQCVSSSSRPQCVDQGCPPQHVCDNGECVELVCSPGCKAGEQCTLLGKWTACLPSDPCQTWEWPQGRVCRTDGDCAEGEVCPPFSNTLAEGKVSVHCTCDAGTGKVGSCANAVEEGRRYCTARAWSCAGANATWSRAQREWCCQHEQVGCPGYLCAGVGAEGPESWSGERREYC
eukprot:Sspe_Gene.99797::Locus_73696_Transcript_1_1_Confidence_1.000_Length_2771::g.99797::m.99797